MITYRLNRHEYHVPDRWEDLKPSDKGKFIRVCQAFGLFETGKMDFRTTEVAVTSALLGLDASVIPEQNDILAENIYRLSERMRFPYSFQDCEDGSRTVSVTIRLHENLLPSVRNWKGYVFHVSEDGIVDCNLTAEQYVDTLSLMDLYTRSRKTEILDSLFMTLYRRTGNRSSKSSSHSSKITRRIPYGYKLAVYYNMRGILEWIKTLPDFRIIFSSDGRKNKVTGSPLGIAGSIFTLSKSGYGTLQEIRNLDLMSYLGTLVQMNIDSIYSLHSVGLKPGEIADKMNLPLDCVLPYIVTDNQE